MWGTLAGAAVSAAGSIYGAIKANNAMRDLKKSVEADKQRNEAWYNRRYNEGATQRADAQRLLSKTEDTMRDRMRAANGIAATTGATEESRQATAAANAAMMGDTAAQIAANGEARKDAIEQQYMSRNDALQGQLNTIKSNKAAGIAQASQGVAAAGAGIMDAFGGRKKEQ